MNHTDQVSEQFFAQRGHAHHEGASHPQVIFREVQYGEDNVLEMQHSANTHLPSSHLAETESQSLNVDALHIPKPPFLFE